LHQNDLELGCKGLDRPQKLAQFRAAIAQFALMCDFARQFAGETKMRRCQIKPASDRIGRGCGIKGGIDFNRGKVPGIEFQPM